MRAKGNSATCFIISIIFLAAILFLGAPAICPASQGRAECAWQVQDREPVVRLHVRAAGDSPAEQNFKRDLVMQVQKFLAGKNFALECDYHTYLYFLEGSLAELENHLLEYAAGVSPGARIAVRLAREEFPPKTYGRRFYPAGEYTALIVTVGEGAGENWWCLLFPSLCLPPAKTEIGSSPEGDLEKAPASDAAGEQGNLDLRDETAEADEPVGTGRCRSKIWELLRSTGQQIIEKAGRIFYN